MKKLFLYAYDRRNLGDDLFVEYIAGRYPDAQFYIWSGAENEAAYGSIPNLRRIDPDSRVVRLLRKLRPSLVARYRAWLENRCDAVAYIGGSIFMEYPNWETICTWWEYEAANRPFYVLGANFGPYHTEAYREKMQNIFRDCRDVCFRDKYSAGLFPGTVRYAPDILFGYEMPRVEIRENRVFVSAIDCTGRDEAHDLSRFDESYVKNMAALLKTQLEQGKEITLASFCQAEGDERGIQKILRALGTEENIRVLRYDGTNRQEMVTALAEAGLVIGTRFHAVVLALAAERPVIPVLYSDKTKHMLQDMGFGGPVVDLREEGNWDFDNPSVTAAAVTAPFTQGSLGHFEKLDAVMGKRL